MEDYEDLVDDAEDQYEDSQDLAEDQLGISESSLLAARKENSDIFNWFWKVAKLGKIDKDPDEDKDSLKLVKVGNMDKHEIGEHGISVRDSLNLAMLGGIFHHAKFGEYWKNRAIITSASSMSKQGWFMDLSISQKKVRERSKRGQPLTAKKWRMFNRKSQPVEE